MKIASSLSILKKIRVYWFFPLVHYDLVIAYLVNYINLLQNHRFLAEILSRETIFDQLRTVNIQCRLCCETVRLDVLRINTHTHTHTHNIYIYIYIYIYGGFKRRGIERLVKDDSYATGEITTPIRFLKEIRFIYWSAAVVHNYCPVFMILSLSVLRRNSKPKTASCTNVMDEIHKK